MCNIHPARSSASSHKWLAQVLAQGVNGAGISFLGRYFAPAKSGQARVFDYPVALRQSSDLDLTIGALPLRSNRTRLATTAPGSATRSARSSSFSATTPISRLACRSACCHMLVGHGHHCPPVPKGPKVGLTRSGSGFKIKPGGLDLTMRA